MWELKAEKKEVKVKEKIRSGWENDLGGNRTDPSKGN